MVDKFGAVVRGNPGERNVSLVFTGDEFRDGLPHISEVLEKKNIKGAFFVTGKFIEDKKSAKLLTRLSRKGHLIGPHSDQHLLYSPWENRDSMLVSKSEFVNDLEKNVERLEKIGIKSGDIFIAPYEWYNKKIVDWSAEIGFEVYNFTPGLRTPADYTYPEMGVRYMSSDKILDQLYNYEKENGLNGFIILIHIGTDKRRTDKLYYRLEKIIDDLQSKNYNFVPLTKL
ncbi:MAG: polysaccharide deacetylase family protein [Sphingobacterium composti]